jgi:hypothetical protein
LLSKDVNDKSVSLLTKCEVVCPITPLEKSGGISMDKEEPILQSEKNLFKRRLRIHKVDHYLDDESLRARFDPMRKYSSMIFQASISKV